ncbi:MULTISPECIES: lauroyl-Kdo(2)-lipid IV(A) myristoyltransferase [unclassified Agarivorans]|uniref:lauroyl-Kdo(2)-lipid IV(A) myristoyltransferase n=1 Tax=unclassified Agarivorans TaxID=2636026 RepID=UPI0026E47B78|nr:MULTISPECIES: lauroyl-Kdo(2)-lipid IV(A) myristoyltransferase [unclassified Agarivorans]MDO6684879.1 lauroyl-Kdo(2)-lipid IV(A) myristoyltransferase [Agarivorans sp. 3_MG-2023]MDO6714960.1 lauroyl-Kdo(2)-lipid IV(A) myristoyltransferase [Agarivorans sp. 2_MG-2023]
MSKFESQAFSISFSKAWLAPKHWGTWLVGGLIVLLAFVPVTLRDRLAVVIANRIFNLKALKKRRAIADTNLKLCFPDMSATEREQLMRKNMQIFAQLILGAGEMSVRSKRYLQNRIVVDGEEHIKAILDNNENFIILLPHTYPVDFLGTYFCTRGHDMCTMFKKTGDPIVDWAMAKQRTRFGGVIFERNAGIKTLIKATRAGYGCIYLPDEDFGPEASLMTPLFETTKATLPVLGKMTKLSGAKVLPIYAGYDSELHKVILYVHPAMEGFPSNDVEHDTLRMNQEVEKLISRSPEQYMWTLKLFRTVEGSDQPRY